MSGGSFDYFYSRGPDSIAHVAAQLEAIGLACERKSNRLGGLDSRDVLAAGLYIGLLARDYRRREAELRALAEVLREVEWCVSGDSSAEDIAQAWRARPVRP